jgi:hypothetical protein
VREPSLSDKTLRQTKLSRWYYPQMHELCQERLALAKTLIDSAALVHKVEREYDTAKEAVPRNTGNVLQLADMLELARVQVRRAQRALDEHIEQHGCLARDGRTRPSTFPGTPKDNGV